MVRFYLQILCKKTGIRTTIIMTVTKNYTKAEGFKSMVEFAIKNKIPLILTPAIPFGNWENNLDVMVTEDDMREMERLHSLYPSRLFRFPLTNSRHAASKFSVEMISS